MRILYVTTISNTVNAFLTPHIKMLVDQGHQVDVAFNIVQKVNIELIELGCKVHSLEFKRSPLDTKNYSAYKRLKKLITSENYDLVHTHTPVASACVRLACRNMKNIKVFYTAHGFHFFKGAPLLNWLVYYPIEKLLSRYTDVLITINKEDFNRAKKSFKSGSVEYIPGVGFDTKRFSHVHVDKELKRMEIGVPESAFVILSVGELNRNKNHETIIKAIKKLNNLNIYYVICGQGPMKNYLIELSKKLGIEKQIKLLGFRNDIDEICKASDIFAFPSKREGLGLAALEAMASGLPIITSNVHGIVDYSVDGVTGYSCCPTDVDGFAKVINYLIEDEKLRIKMSKHNIEAVNKFNLNKVKDIMQDIYKSIYVQNGNN